MQRHPAVAGSFYPENARQLHQLVTGYLDEVHTLADAPKAMIVPHAGYIYSGSVAASAYARLKPANGHITRVVLIGPSHRAAFRGLAVSNADSFSTPLGDIPVDQQAVAAIAELPFVNYLEQAHAYEHSLEVQLPFLQETLQGFCIVPIVAGDATAAEVADVLEMLWGDAETLVVVSSDLSHYHDYATAKALDQLTSENIEHKQYESISYESACGKVPLSGLLKLAKDKCLAIKTIDLRNSGDTAGDKSRVVGYGAYVIE